MSDETFLTESQLKENEKKEKVSAESGHPVKWVEESNYMFKLSKLHEQLEYWIRSRFVKLLYIIYHERFFEISFFSAIQFVQRNSKGCLWNT